MKTTTQIGSMIEKLFEHGEADEYCAIAGQALAWVLGDEISPLDYIKDLEKEDELDRQTIAEA